MKIQRIIKFVLFLVYLLFSQELYANDIYRGNNKNYFSSIDGAELVKIPAGIYYIGYNWGRYNEKPEIQVKLSGYLIDKYEITNEQFENFVLKTGYAPKGSWKQRYKSKDKEKEFPVRFVTWEDANAYAQWVGRRLPTEVEWEVAVGKNMFPWGNSWKKNIAITHLPISHGPKEVRRSEDISLFGVVNLGGNVREWVSDWYDHYHYQSLRDKIVYNPQGPSDRTPPEKRFIDTRTSTGNERSTRKIVRGASWVSKYQQNIYKYRRWAHNPKQWFNDIGFRCATNIGEGQ